MISSKKGWYTAETVKENVEREQERAKTFWKAKKENQTSQKSQGTAYVQDIKEQVAYHLAMTRADEERGIRKRGRGSMRCIRGTYNGP